MPAFCRHNRFEHRCPICSKDAAAAAAPPRKSPAERTPGAARRAGARSTAPRTGRLVTRKLARADDDGYRNDLVPGIKASADAERLAACLAVAARRLQPPGPYPVIAEVAAGDAEHATWVAFLLAVAGPDQPELQAAIATARPGVGEAPDAGVPAGAVRGYQAFVARQGGSQRAAFTGDEGWTPERRFGRVFERMTIPGFGRAERFEMLAALGAAGVYPLAADALHVDYDDATVRAAKRALVSGEWMLLERRAKALAEGTAVPLAALDRGLALWDGPAVVEAPESDELELIRDALALG